MYDNELDAKLVFAKSKHYQAYLDSNGKKISDYLKFKMFGLEQWQSSASDLIDDAESL